MTIHDVKYVGSFSKNSNCPKPVKPEFAFIGRSNVGKSSLINMLVQRKDLARTSKQPGKTQMLNFYDVNESWHIVDLPGYGFAKVSKKQRGSWEKMIENYLVLRESLQCAFVLLDSRHDLQKIDLEFMMWLGERAIPFAIIFTKVDKLKPGQRSKQLKRIKTEILKYWHSLPDVFVSSAEKHEGRKDILEFIENLNAGINTAN